MRATSLQFLPLRCVRCGHEWSGYIANSCQYKRFADSLALLCEAGCPACPAGAMSIRLVCKAVDAVQTPLDISA